MFMRSHRVSTKKKKRTITPKDMTMNHFLWAEHIFSYLCIFQHFNNVWEESIKRKEAKNLTIICWLKIKKRKKLSIVKWHPNSISKEMSEEKRMNRGNENWN